jgi:hypothetical protein
MTTRSYRRVSDSTALMDLTACLLDRDRSIAMIVVSNRRSGGEPCVNPERLQAMCKGHAQVYLISATQLGTYNERLQNIFGITPSGMRIYRPQMTMQDHHLRHPIWNENRIDQMIANGSFPSEVERYITTVKRFANGRNTMRQEPAPAPKPTEHPRRPILRISMPG